LIIISFSDLCISQIKSNSLLNNYDFSAEGSVLIKLPKSLKEISGLALLNDKELVTHNDEEGMIYTLKVSNYELVSKLKIGDEKIQKDFEGIAVIKDTVYLVTSNGVLYKINYSKKSDATNFLLYKTTLKTENDVEGLCYDKNTNSLLLACKNEPGMGKVKSRTVYTFSLRKMKLEHQPRFVISLKELKQKYGFKDFSPSGIEKNPANGNYFVLSSNPPSVIELNPNGKILAAVKLNSKVHQQSEGITFLNDGTMLISDEGQTKSGKITIYKLKTGNK
jgi:uncharacterized protein YjiK